MKKNIIPLILIFSLIFLSSIEARKISELPSKYKKWVGEEVVCIITSKEEEVFRELETDKQRDLFIEEFWKQRDPTPGTPQNEFKEEHYRRIEYANKRFGRGTAKPGSKTERGRIYIILGEPIYMQRFSGGEIYPVEMWFYQGNVSQGLEPFFYIIFFKRYGIGDYVLYSPMMDTSSSLSPLTSGVYRTGGPGYKVLDRVSPFLAEASVSLIPGRSDPGDSERLLGNVNSVSERKVDDEYAYEFLKDKASVEVSYSVHYIGNTSTVKTLQDGFGLFFVHYSIQPQNLSLDGYKDKYYSNLKISGRVTDSKGKTVFQYNREYPLEFSKKQIKQLKLIPMTIQDSFPLVPGNYKFSLLLENTVSKEFTSFDKDIIILEIKDAPQMSDLVLAYMKKKNKESLKSPFKVKEMILFPCLKKEFTSEDTLSIFFQLYGFSEQIRDEGWIIYTFFKQGKNHHVRRKKIIDYKDKKNFLEEFSLNDFPPATYRVKVSVLDINEKEVLIKEDKFSVSSKISARPWVQFKRYPSSGDPIYCYIKGIQSLNKGEMQKAQRELKIAHEMKPEREDFAVGYAQVLLENEDYKEIKKVLSPFAEKSVSDYSLFYLLGMAHQREEEYEKAIAIYQKYISHEGASINVLNSIGECYIKLGDSKQALRVLQKSLEINPDQERIKKIVESLKREE